VGQKLGIWGDKSSRGAEVKISKKDAAEVDFADFCLHSTGVIV